MLDFSNPQIWWFLTRASAIVAWALMTLTVVWGILLKTRILRGADNPEWLKVTHRYISGLAIAMIAVHLYSLWRDEYVEFGWADIFVPFRSSYETVAVTLGVFAFWLVVAIQVTALAAKWLPEWLWKGVHLTSYIAIALVAIHSGWAGSDVGAPWYTAVSLVLITTATLAGVIRLIIASRPRPQRTEAPALSTPRQPHTQLNRFHARVIGRESVGEGVAVFTLEPESTPREFEWEAGAHITLHLGNGLERQYSLAGDPADQKSLLLAVQNTRGEGGGSAWIHENLDIGDSIECDLPRNNFPLRPSHRYQFIASGVGITPIRSMLASLPASREWSLLYLGRNRSDMPFVDELERLYGDRVTIWCTGERQSRADLSSWVVPSADVYACGSPGLLDELEELVAPRRLHVERFEPKKRTSMSATDSFTVVAARTGLTSTVPSDSSLLEVLESNGVTLPTSCRRGVCGSCELRVIEGIPEHLDSVMTDQDKDELGIMYPCVSRSKTPILTVDA